MWDECDLDKAAACWDAVCVFFTMHPKVSILKPVANPLV
jgi:hypothetical protein